MESGEGFLMRPCKAGMCKYESMIDGTFDLADVAALNEYLDIEAENQMRIGEFLDLNRSRDG